MDILKILSRSTKQKGNSASTRADNPTLPSAGTSATPQLFNDVVAESRGKKRKRGGGKLETDEQSLGDGVTETLNFFTPKPSTARTNADDNSVIGGKAKASAHEIADSTPFELLEEAECRQILRSHRLKVTLLPISDSTKSRARKTKEGRVAKKKSTRKPQFTQLYPQPLATFGDLRKAYGISGRMAENLANNGYRIPTEVQMGSLPLLLQPDVALGQASKAAGISDTATTINLLSVAPTGSGKTLAFLIPIINQIIHRRRKSDDKVDHHLDAVVIAPTKELANQIVNEAKKLSLGTGVKVLGMRKGLKVVDHHTTAHRSDDENEDVQEGDKRSSLPIAKADILVTTPGLLLSAVSTSITMSNPLPHVRTLVLDEADVLLDPLFRDQVLGIWSACTNPELRVTLWSATMGSNIESLASATIQSRQEKLRLVENVGTIRLVVGLKDSAIPNIKHTLTYAATEPGKLLALRQLLHPTAKSKEGEQSLRPPFLIFTQTIPRAIALHSELLYDIPAEAGGSSRIAVLHSDLSDLARDNVMSRFRKGEVWILITTDILSRGVDFRGINGVVNYDVPNSGAAYIHRVGRTGRAGRGGGVAITFYTKEDVPYVKTIANIIAASEKQAGLPSSEASMQKWFLDALPNPTKNEKKSLKQHGVKARQGGQLKTDANSKAGTNQARTQISTKSGYERKLEHNRKGAIEGSKRRAQAETEESLDASEEAE